jgi:hypothetical protein
MKISYLVILLSLVALNALSQKNSYVIKGTVKNVHDQPIENVNIFCSTKIGTTTDSNGKFELTVTPSDKTLYLSHLAYKEKKINIDQNTVLNGTLSIQIILEESQYRLDAVDILADKNWQVIKPERVWIYDYALYKNNLIVLLKDSVKYELRYLNDNDSLLSKYTINKRHVKGFINDGLGNIHIAINDSIYQLFIHKSNISFYEGISNHEYEKIIKPIVAKTDSLIIWHHYFLNNQRLIYTGIKKRTKTIIPINDIFNKKLYDYSVEAREQEMRYSGVNIMGYLTPELLDRYREYYQWGKFFDKVATFPIYSPLIKTNDGFCIFDLINNKINHFDESGILIKAVESSFNSNKKIIDIKIDKSKNKVYSMWKNNGNLIIDEIDIQNGTTKKSYSLKKHLNISKVNLYNEKVYFLRNKKNEKKKLIRKPLDQLPTN